jgi:hypothetical protein
MTLLCQASPIFALGFSFAKMGRFCQHCKDELQKEHHYEVQ